MAKRRFKQKIERVDFARMQQPAKSGWHFEACDGAQFMVRNGYHTAKCTGEAHSNPWIDNCMSCAPMWGVKTLPDGYEAAWTRLEAARDAVMAACDIRDRNKREAVMVGLRAEQQTAQAELDSLFGRSKRAG